MTRSANGSVHEEALAQVVDQLCGPACEAAEARSLTFRLDARCDETTP